MPNKNKRDDWKKKRRQDYLEPKLHNFYIFCEGAKNKIQKGQIWCVYDKDSFPAKNFNAVIDRIKHLNLLNSDLQYHAAWSNECIEFWFFLHFA